MYTMLNSIVEGTHTQNLPLMLLGGLQGWGRKQQSWPLCPVPDRPHGQIMGRAWQQQLVGQMYVWGWVSGLCLLTHPHVISSCLGPSLYSVCPFPPPSLPALWLSQGLHVFLLSQFWPVGALEQILWLDRRCLRAHIPWLWGPHQGSGGANRLMYPALGLSGGLSPPSGRGTT